MQIHDFYIKETPVDNEYQSNAVIACSSGSRRSHSTAIEKFNDLKIVLHAL